MELDAIMKELTELKKSVSDFSAAYLAKNKAEADTKVEMEKLGKQSTATAELLARASADVAKLAEGAAKASERIEKLERELAASNRSGKDSATKAGPYVKLGEQMQDVHARCIGKAAPRLDEIKAPSGLSEGTPSDGGYLVQTDFSTELLKRTYDIGGILSRVRRIPISASANSLKLYGINETSRATGSRMGGVQVYWADEAGTKTKSKPSFRMMELVLKKLVALVYATDELLQDAAALEAIIMDVFPQEMNFTLENAVIRGTGVGQPLGILSSGAVVTVSQRAGQGAGTIIYENIIDMWSRLWARSQSNAVWLINQDCLPQLATMTLDVGTGGMPVYLPANGAAGSPYGTLMGRPVIPVEYCSTVGTVGDIMLVDLSQYIMVEKGGMQSASSIHVRFINDETVYRFVMRADGQSSWNSALTPFSGSSNTLSPFVVLETRS